jgi:hypothetical protein
MIRYAISTGELTRDGEPMGTGYSGQPSCRNDPEKCGVRNEGPIPPGLYRIGDPVNTETHGPYVLPLDPDPDNDMLGRHGFLIHGDSVSRPGTASHGCIIMPRKVREAVHESGDRDLEVTVD